MARRPTPPSEPPPEEEAGAPSPSPETASAPQPGGEVPSAPQAAAGDQPSAGEEAKDAAAAEAPREEVSGGRGGAWGAALGAAVLVIVAGAVATVLAWPTLEAQLEARIDAAIGDAFESNEAELTALRARLGALETRLGELASRADVEATTGALSARIAALEGRLDDLANALPSADLAERVAALESRARAEASPAAELGERLAALESALQEALAEAASARAALAERLDQADRRSAALDERLADLERRIAGLASQTGAAARGPALTLAVAELRAALAEALPFAAALEAVRTLIGDDPEAADALATLAPLAETGVPSLASLRSRFSVLAPEIVRAAIAPETGAWWERTLARVARLVSFRRLGEVEGESVEARVARAEQRLADGDLAAAVAEIERLTGEPAVVAAPWLEDARRRLAALQALATLEARAAVALAGG